MRKLHVSASANKEMSRLKKALKNRLSSIMQAEICIYVHRRGSSDIITSIIL